MGTVIACVIANLITIALLGCGAYYLYKKYKTDFSALVSDIKEGYANVSESISKIKDTIESIKG